MSFAQSTTLVNIFLFGIAWRQDTMSLKLSFTLMDTSHRDECRFKPMKVKEMIQEVLNEKLEGQKYHVDKVLLSES
jgi:hypothetical protein